MALLLGFGVKKCPGPVSLAVVFKLKGVSADKYLGRSYKAGQHLSVIIHKCLICSVGGIACHDEKHRNDILIYTGSFKVIGKALENKSLIQGTE